jgi:outer membrane autotransporter protein
MSKKLLISTVLSSALLASAANAANYNISHDGTKYDVNGTKFDGFLEVGGFINAGGFVPGTDTIGITKGAGLALFGEASSENITNEQLNQFINIALANGVTKAEIDAINLSFNNQQEIRAIESESNDISDFMKKNNIADEFKGDVVKFARDAAVIQDLSQAEKLSQDQSAQLKDTIESIRKNPSINAIRKSADLQEGLKDEINDIKKIQNDAGIDKETKERVSKIRLARLETILDIYMDKNPTSGANVAPVQKPDTAVSDAIMDTSMVTRNLVDSRVNSFSGAASGDIMETYGVWAKGSFTQATQKAFGSTDGYAASQKGFTIGADSGDESLVGIAYSFYKNDVKNKATKANKEDIASHTLSAYGKADITNEIFATGQVQYGISNIKKKRATGDTKNNIATAKTKAATIAGKAQLGYNFDTSFNNIHIVPTAGIAYTNVAVKGYSESGDGLNRKVGKRTSNRTSAVAGLMIKHIATSGDMKFIPEVHANIDYAFKTKNSSTTVTILDGIAPIATPSQKLTKAYYNVGTSVKAIQSDMFEISAGYDLGLAKKFKSHTGTLKVRVNL